MKNLKKYKTAVLFFIGALFCLVLIVGYVATPRVEAVAQPSYAATRQCDFVTVGGLIGVFCTDGTNWTASPLAPTNP